MKQILLAALIGVFSLSACAETAKAPKVDVKAQKCDKIVVDKTTKKETCVKYPAVKAPPKVTRPAPSSVKKKAAEATKN